MEREGWSSNVYVVSEQISGTEFQEFLNRQSGSPNQQDALRLELVPKFVHTRRFGLVVRLHLNANYLAGPFHYKIDFGISFTPIRDAVTAAKGVVDEMGPNR
jgi:hypothetical protein